MWYKSDLLRNMNLQNPSDFQIELSKSGKCDVPPPPPPHTHTPLPCGYGFQNARGLPAYDFLLMFNM